MRKILFEKNQKIVTKAYLKEAFKKAITDCEVYSSIIFNDSSFAMSIKGTWLSIAVSNYSEDDAKIRFNDSLKSLEEFHLELSEYLELKRFVENRRDELHHQEIKKKESAVDSLKNFMTI